MQAIQEAGHDVLVEQTRHIALPKRFRLPIREIWSGQERLRNRRGKRAFTMLESKRFRAIYDFLLLRHEAGESDLESLCEWWTEFQDASAERKQEMCGALHEQRHGQRPRRRKPKRND